MRRLLVLVATTGLMLGAAGLAHAQVHDDPTTEGTTGLFMIPRVGTLEEGTWSGGVSYSTFAREEGDSLIRTFGINGAYGLSYRMELYFGFQPRVSINRRFTAERDLIPRLPNPPRTIIGSLTGMGINDHPYAFFEDNSGVGDLWAGFKYRLVGDPYEYDGVALQGWVGFPTSDTDVSITSLSTPAIDTPLEGGVGCGCFQVGGRVIGSLEAWDLIGWNIYAGYRWYDSPDQPEVQPYPGNWFVSPEVLYGIGFQFPSRSSLQLLFEWMGTVTTRDMNMAFTGGDDISMLQWGLRLTTDSGWAVNAAANYNTTIAVRAWESQVQPEAIDDALRRWGFLLGASYSTSRRQPVAFMGSDFADVDVLNRPPTLTCRAERTTIRQGESVRVMATTSDTDGDPLTVSWRAAAGSLSSNTGNEVTWSSRGVAPGSGNIVGRVDDSYGGTADCTVRVTVEAPPPPAEATVLSFACGEFPSGNSRIDNRCKAVLDDVALQLRQNPGATAAITGHSDSAGSATRNDEMAQERADNARAYLVDTHGIDPSRITTASAGSSQPAADNSTRAGRAQNRRIEVVVTIPPR